MGCRCGVSGYPDTQKPDPLIIAPSAAARPACRAGCGQFPAGRRGRENRSHAPRSDISDNRDAHRLP
ncbi:unnamed protein product, partial [Didymodactylos carnosus]